jgi:hypothetical protein
MPRGFNQTKNIFGGSTTVTGIRSLNRHLVTVTANAFCHPAIYATP